MPRFNPFNLQAQISRMFVEGQSFFATTRVQDWLREHNEDPNDYDITFHQEPAPPGSGLVLMVRVELRRKDGQPVADWLQQELDQFS
ncbi:hypothetical protein ACQ4M4_20025 [Leptolyngbya sp. AN02str]|uniref:hypothetical protein n=1 Tax=Leptolyngbya sp. AN02str TaxID=3423363 RepID=UPI003D31CC88